MAARGRPPGAPNKRTSKAAAPVVGNKHDPLQVQLRAMNALVAKADRLTAPEQEDERIEVLKEAAAVAKDITPYRHSKLSTAIVNVSGSISHEKDLDALELLEAATLNGREAGEPTAH